MQPTIKKKPRLLLCTYLLDQMMPLCANLKRKYRMAAINKSWTTEKLIKMA